jgi:uncharacterized protein YcnI
VAVAATSAAGILLFAVPAFAHITVSPGSAQPGSSAVLTFHVPNEEAKAYTTRVDVQIPTDHPIAQLLVQPVAGWTISVKTVTLAKPLVTDDGQFTQAVSEVIWSGGKVAPGQFQDFSLSADPLPQGVSQLTFKAIQTYSNGDVVRWIDLRQPGQAEPDHPAPVLTLTAAAGAGGTAGTGATAGTAAPSASAAASGSDGTARGIAAGGVLIGLLGLVLAGLSWRRAKASTAVAKILVPALDGQAVAMASAVGPAQEQGNGTNRPRSAQPGPESRPAGPAREAPKRRGASGRRGTSHR